MLDFFVYSFLLLIAVCFFICSFQFAHQKWHALIAGYNDLSEKQKQQVDFEAICKSTSRCAFAGGIYSLCILGFLYLLSSNEKNPSTALLFFAVSSALFLIYILRAVVKSSTFYKSS